MNAAPLELTLHDQIALVTGASSGLGEHFARVLSRAGAKVILCARRKERLSALEAELTAHGAHAIAIPMDVTDPDSVREAFAQMKDFGQPTIIVNNAGVAQPMPVLEQTEEHWRYTMDTNLDGAWRVATTAARQLVEAKTPGCIINIASVAGLSVGGQLGAYAISKAALLHMTRSMALELGRHKIRVNAIAPGYFSTEMNAGFLESPQGQRLLKAVPTGRFGELEDLDGPLLLLASKAGHHITGQCIVVDGGHILAGTH